ncbi:MAG: hypothetical protein IRZ23_10910 [Acetobacteraceae bacterium]|nr:hypothetical protein [Acetobacteraceae bacterium]
MPLSERQRQVIRRVVRLAKIGANGESVWSLFGRSGAAKTNEAESQALATLKQRLSAFPLFDAEDYAALHADVRASGMDPKTHFITHGVFEQRAFAKPETIIARLSAYSADLDETYFAEPALTKARLSRLRSQEIGVFVHSRGNFFMREIAELLLADLRALSLPATLGDERSDPAACPPISIFVAPHEFFALEKGTAWTSRALVARSFLYPTEQFGTSWGAPALPYVLTCRGVLESNPQSWHVFRATGVPSLFYFPGFPQEDIGLAEEPPRHPLLAGLPKAVRNFSPARSQWKDRPLDILFIGAESPLREAFFAEHAAFFAARPHCLYYVRLGEKPFAAEDDGDPRPALNRYLAQRAKIILNLHQSPVPYFEWHRIVVQGMWNGAVVVSDKCLPHPIFHPGEHYFESNAESIPELMRWILDTPEGQREAMRVQANALAALRGPASRPAMAARLAGFLLGS